MDVPPGDPSAEPDPASPPPCGSSATLPDWVSVSPDGRTFTATCPKSTVRLTAWSDGILRIRTSQDPAWEPGSSFAVQVPPDPSAVVSAGREGPALAICTPRMRVFVAVDSCALRVQDLDLRVLLEDAPGGALFSNAGTTSIRRTTPADEHFYGLGEKTGSLDRRGRKLMFWNTDSYQDIHHGWAPDQDPLYQSIPFFVGLRGTLAYGLFTDDPGRLEMDLAATDPGIYRIDSRKGGLDQYLLAGPAIREVLQRYSVLTGRMPLPPAWSLGYHQSRWGYSPASRVLEIARGFRDRNIAADAIWLDIQHLHGFRSWTWDPETFADPKGLVDSLATLGFKTLTIVDPGLLADPEWDVYTEGLAGEHFLKDPDGSVYQGKVWADPAVFPDFTSAECRTWWGGLAKRETSQGVAGLWIDMNEPTDFIGPYGTVPGTLVAACDGHPTTMDAVHNAYALAEARATSEGLAAAIPDRRPFVLSRAGYAGIQRYAAVWTGDAPSTWETLDQSLAMLLGLGLSGVPFAGTDVGGYGGNAPAELFARWMQVGSISPFFRGHVRDGVPDQEPWAFGPEVEIISREAIGLRYELFPYLYSVFATASETGVPVLRPLVLDFQDDPATHAIGDEALLGPGLLVAPVIASKVGTATFYLPAGRWFDFRSGAVLEGPGATTLDVTLAALPLYAREGALIPRQARASTIAPGDPWTLEAYPGAAETAFTTYDDSGDGPVDGRRVTYTVRRTATGAVLVAGPALGGNGPDGKRMVVRLLRVDHEPSTVTRDGNPLTRMVQASSGAGEGWWWDSEDLALSVALDRRSSFTLEATYDTSLLGPAPDVKVRFEVTPPAGTPTDKPLAFASSANGWTQQAMTWDPGTGKAWIVVPIPRGQWVFYKYTRGAWDTVEKWPGCQEATNRYAFAAAHVIQQDSVAMWADACR